MLTIRPEPRSAMPPITNAWMSSIGATMLFVTPSSMALRSKRAKDEAAARHCC